MCIWSDCSKPGRILFLLLLVDCTIIEDINHTFIRDKFEGIYKRLVGLGINDYFTKVHKIILSHYGNHYILECFINYSTNL